MGSMPSRAIRASIIGAASIALSAAAAPARAADEAAEAASEAGDGIIVTGKRESYKVDDTATTAKLPLSLRETPQSVTVITRQQIEDFNLNSIADVLQQTPGVTISSTDSNRTSFLSRGFAITNFQIDGVPTVWQTSGYANSVMSDMSIYERVEVVRGSAGLNAGTGDPSGTVNLVRKAPTDLFGASFAITGGSWNYMRGEADFTGPITADGTLRGRAVAAYTYRHSHVDFQRDTIPSLYAVLEWDATPTTLVRLGADYQETISDGGAWSGVPLFATDGSRIRLPRSYSASARWTVWQRDMLNLFGRIEQRLGGDWVARVSYNQRKTTAESDLFAGGDGFADRNGDGLAFNRNTGQWATWRFYGENHQMERAVDAYVSGPLSLFGRSHELVLGANWFKRDFDVYYSAVAPGQSLPPFGNIFTWNGETPRTPVVHNYQPDWTDHARETGFYGALRLNPADGLKVIVGGRYTDYEFYTENFTEAGLPDNRGTTLPISGRQAAKRFAPYGGITLDVNDELSLYASYSQLFRVQTQLIAAGETAPPLEGTNYELGLKSELLDKNLYFAFAGFHMVQKNALISDPGRPNPLTPGSFYFNVIPGIKTWGFEAEVTGRITDRWNVSGGYTRSRSTGYNAAQRRIIRQFTTQPVHIARINTTYQFGGDLKALMIGGGVSWQSRIYNTVNAPTGVVNGFGTPVLGPRVVTQGSYAVANLMARYKLGDNVQVGLNVSNLFDKWYFRNVAANGYYGEPRKIMFNIRYSVR